MIDYTTIGKRIQTRRQERNITQEKLAEQVGISVVYLSKIENGRVYPTLETLSRGTVHTWIADTAPINAPCATSDATVSAIHFMRFRIRS